MEAKIKRLREIRVFLSSTFKDMEAERNHLIKRVFPKIRAVCHARQVGFTEIDLRWGITEEESKNGVTVEICLKEINRCRDFPPFFIGFLGERYGWIPCLEDLSAYWDAREKARKHFPDMLPEDTDSESRSYPENEAYQYEQLIRKAIGQKISVTELEMKLAVLDEGAADRLHSHALFLLRDGTLTNRLYQEKIRKIPECSETDFYDPAGDKLPRLKKYLRNSPFIGIDGYTSIKEFGDVIENYLIEQINHYFPVKDIQNKHQLSDNAHAIFRYQRLQNLIPRADVRQTLIAAITKRQTAPNLGPILISGPSGHGKSVILADLARYLESLPGYRVIDHYIGADGNNSLNGWVHRILRVLYSDIKDQVSSIPNDLEEQIIALPDWLLMAANRNQCRYVLILDALDQLNDQGKDIRILCHSCIGAAVTLIASAVTDTPAVNSADALGFDIHVVPPFDIQQRESFIGDTLRRYRKTMQPQLVHRIALAPSTGSPIFLMLAVEKLRLDSKHESLDSDVNSILAQHDAGDLFLTQFLIDEDYGRPGQSTLALEFMALLAASRGGLTEYELAELLAMPTDPVSEETGLPRLPQIYLSRLLSVFQPFLICKQANRSLMHSLFRATALNAYGAENARKKIVEYFEREWGADRNLDRVAIELVGQLYVLHDDKLKAVITDPRIALRICEKNSYEFSFYWFQAVQSIGESAHHAEILARRLIELQENNQSDWATRSTESLCLADAFIKADEVESASRLYHAIVIQSKLTGSRIPANNIKDALRGFIRCYTKMMLDNVGCGLDEKSSQQLFKMGGQAISFMEYLLSITSHDSRIDRAEDALLLSELREKHGYLIGQTYEDEDLRAQDIAHAINILESDNCLRSQSFYNIKAKAYTMELKVKLDAISRSWDAPYARNRMIIQTLEIAKKYHEYIQQHLFSSHPQCVLMFELLHSLYSQAAYATLNGKNKMEYLQYAVTFAWKTIEELQQSYFIGNQNDMRLLNAAETILLALEAGFPVNRNDTNILLRITNLERQSETTSHQIREFSKEIHSRLLKLI